MPESPKRGSGIARMLSGAARARAFQWRTAARALGRGIFVLNESRATGTIYDSVTDVTHVFVSRPPGTVRTHTVAADLLLDAKGFLVAIDIEPETRTRAIVMLGAHENVARKVSARIGVCKGANGEVFEVRIAEARATIRGHEKSPY
jgi:hypothetical protein